MSGPSVSGSRIQTLLETDLSLATGSSALIGELACLPAGDIQPIEDPVRLPQLVGFDEAGRGALAGPVVVGCVAFRWSQLRRDERQWRDELVETYARLNDSKQVNERTRECLHQHITTDADWGIGCASAREIDRIGIVAACCNAARRAYGHLSLRGTMLLFDRGLGLPESGAAATDVATLQLTKGDARSFHIAAASILAKVGRDAIMRHLGSRDPAYGFAQHKGYGTAAHQTAIRTCGPGPFHRRSFLRSILS